MNFTQDKSLEFENDKHINLGMRTKEEPLPGEYRTQVDPYGMLVRKSHAHYVGSIVLKENKLSVGVVTQFKPTETVISKSKIHGYGAFAIKDYAVGDVVEEFYCILLDTTTESSTDFILNRYGLLWECNCDICKNNGKTFVIPTGNVLTYNHSDTPNVFISIEKPLRRGKVIALTEIKVGEEILRYYGKEHEKLLEKEPLITTRLDVPEGLPVRTASDELDELLTPKQKIDLSNTEIVESDTNSLSSTMFRSMIVPEKLL
jgi:hypothetical protein